MYEQIVKLENNISIHISHAEIPPLSKNFTPKYETQLVSRFHLHNEYEFFRINRGIIRCITLDNEFILEEGDVMFINKYVPHSTYSEMSDTHITLIQFNLPSDTESIIRYISRFKNVFNFPAFAFKKNNANATEIKNSIDSIAEEYVFKKPFWNDYVYNHMLMLITALRRQGIIAEVPNKKIEVINKIRPALEYINEHYAENISTLNLSELMNFNETYFCRLFKRIIGTSAVNYINFVRVCKAEKLLKNNISVSEVANKTGFSSPSYFNRVFKKYMHYSPSDYKKITNTQ